MLRKTTLRSAVARGCAAIVFAVLLFAPRYVRADGCTASSIVFQFTTGADDLRGVSDNLNLELHFTDGTIQFVENLNHNAAWGAHTLHSVTVPLKQPRVAPQIEQIKLVHVAQSGVQFISIAPPFPIVPTSEDNWDMAKMTATAVGSGVNALIATAGPHRFTGSDPAFTVTTDPPLSCHSGDITQLRFTFHTGNDDLRGGNDNLNVIVHYGGGTPDQFENNVNHSVGWPGNSTRDVTIFLNQPNAVSSVTLQTTFTGGANGDNWDMAQLQVTGTGLGIHRALATAGFNRFTGPPGNSLTVPLTGWPPPPVPTVSGWDPNAPSRFNRPHPFSPGGLKPLSTGANKGGSPSGNAPVSGSNLGASSAGRGPMLIAPSQGTLLSAPAQAQSAQGSASNGQLLSSRSGGGSVLTNGDVIALVQGGASETTVISKIKSAQRQFDFSPAGCRTLSQAHVSANVLRAMGDGSVVSCRTRPLRPGRQVQPQ